MIQYKAHMAEAENIRQNIYKCHACPLGKQANRVPFGGVTWVPRLILLGEAPGASEDEAGEPFVGKAGACLEGMMERVGLQRHHGMYINTVCCRPPGNRDPEWSEITACSVHRKLQTRLGRTWVGMILGRVALSVMRNEPHVTLGEWKGRPFWAENKLWIPTYHPAYVLRNPKVRDEVVGHLRSALRFLAGEIDPPIPSGAPEYTMERGCVVVNHEATHVPERYLQLVDGVVFTRSEWAKLTYAGEPTLRAAIAAKRGLGATVVK